MPQNLVCWANKEKWQKKRKWTNEWYCKEWGISYIILKIEWIKDKTNKQKS